MSSEDTDAVERAIRQRAKLVIRKRMRAVRAALPDAACDARSARIIEHVLALEELRNARTVLAFASIRNEVRTDRFITALHRGGTKVALPRVVEDELALHRVAPGDVLNEGAFEVPEPAKDSPSVDVADVDFVIVPALAADTRGHRIGYGGGYYDRLLPRLTRATTCVLVYDFQLIAEVPELPFDRTVDLVVTDTRVIRIG